MNVSVFLLKMALEIYEIAKITKKTSSEIQEYVVPQTGKGMLDDQFTVDSWRGVLKSAFLN